MPLTNKDTEIISDDRTSQFYKHRKILSCISDGISIFTDNFLQYTMATFIPTTVVAVILAIFSFIILKYCANETFVMQTVLQSIVTWIILIIITLLLVLHTCISYVFIEHKCIKKHTLGLQHIYLISFKRLIRVLFFYLVNICTYVITGICLYYIFSKNIVEMNSHDFFNIFGCSVAALLVIIYSLPYNLVLPTLMYEKVGLLNGFIRGYKLGVSIWVRNFTLFILLFFIKLILGTILLAPALIHFAIFKSYIDALVNGDSAYLPEVFIISLFVITFLTTIILIYFTTSLNISYIFLYSSAITDKKEKENNYIPIV